MLGYSVEVLSENGTEPRYVPNLRVRCTPSSSQWQLISNFWQVRAVADIQSGGATYPSVLGACEGTKYTYDSKKAALDAVSVDCPIGSSYFCSGRTGAGLYLSAKRSSGSINGIALISCLVMFVVMIGVLIGFIVACLRSANRKEHKERAAPVEMAG